MSSLSQAPFVVIVNGRVVFRSNDRRAAHVVVKPRGVGRSFVEFRFDSRQGGRKGGAR